MYKGTPLVILPTPMVGVWVEGGGGLTPFSVRKFRNHRGTLQRKDESKVHNHRTEEEVQEEEPTSKVVSLEGQFGFKVQGSLGIQAQCPKSLSPSPRPEHICSVLGRGGGAVAVPAGFGNRRLALAGYEARVVVLLQALIWGAKA